MDAATPTATALSATVAARFIAIGLALYAILFGASEWLVHRNGYMNPIHRIETATRRDFDWVVLGASHAMPLGFDGFGATIEARTGRSILNLAGPGTGPLYNRFVLEHLLRRRQVRNVLYVADNFVFLSPAWNEERFSDRKLLARTPLSLPLIASLARYTWREGVDPRALLDYVTGFSKLNDRNRFRRDVWEGEAQFDRVFRPSATADRKRVEYLYPEADRDAARARYLDALARLIRTARESGAAVTVAKFPLPSRFKALLPGEDEHDARLRRITETEGATFVDYSEALDEPRFYSDTDHLNRAGVEALLDLHLSDLLTGDAR